MGETHEGAGVWTTPVSAGGRFVVSRFVEPYQQAPFGPSASRRPPRAPARSSLFAFTSFYFFFYLCYVGVGVNEKQEAGGQKPRVLSIDDYYMAEVMEEKTDERGVKRKVAVMKYQHDAEMEEVQ